MIYLAISIVLAAFMLCSALARASENIKLVVNFPREIEVEKGSYSYLVKIK